MLTAFFRDELDDDMPGLHYETDFDDDSDDGRAHLNEGGRAVE
jgi:hypothetical protein